MKQTQRLDKILAHLGHGTRSELKKLVKSGAVKVNGELVKDSGLQVRPYDDLIEIEGEPIRYREYVYIMMNKPQGVVSATEDNRERTVLDLLPRSLQAFHPFPVGRLDKDTEGLLLLTNDGGLAHNLLSPRKHVNKRYYAEVQGAVNEQDRMSFSEGVILDDGYRTMPAQLEILNVGGHPDRPVSSIELTIQEGKFHQVKRMFEAIGKKVIFLKRSSMGPLELDETLVPGQFRELTEQELRELKGDPQA